MTGSAAGPSPAHRHGASPRTGAHLALLAFLPTLLALLGEGAWVAVLAALLQAAVQQPVDLGPVPFAVAGLAGMVAAARLVPPLGRAWPAAAVGLVAVAGLVGWLAAPTARAALLDADPAAALGIHPAGWLAGLAFLRGVAHGDPADRIARAAGTAGSLLGIGLLVIVTAFLLGGAIAEPGRSTFTAAAIPATVVFLAATLVGSSLGRVAELGRSGGLDWRRNPVWTALLVALVAAILVLSVPGSFVVGPLVVFVVALLPVPLLVVGLLSGLDRRAMRLLVLVTGVAVAAFVLIRALAGPGTGLTGGGGGGQMTPTTTADPPWMTAAAWTVLLVVLAALVAFLAWLWMRQARVRPDDDVDEVRTIDRGHVPGNAPRRRWRRPMLRHPTPTDAVSAYRAAVAELDRVDAVRRGPHETPSEHAGRLRGASAAAGLRHGEAGFGSALDRLAADYELARFAARRLTAREHDRAIERWRRIRAAIRRGGRAT